MGVLRGFLPSSQGGGQNRAVTPTPAPAPDAAADARTALREAQGRAADTARAALEAAWLVERGAAVVAETCAELDRFADLDDLVAAAGANALRAGVSPGRAGLPAALVADRAARAAAQEDYSDALNTHALLIADAATAAAADAAAREAVAKAADVVAQCVGLGMATEVRALELTVGKLRGLLMGLPNSRGATDPPVAWGITQLAHDPQHAPLVDSAGPSWREAGLRWTAFRAALVQDADAALPDAAEPPPGLAA